MFKKRTFALLLTISIFGTLLVAAPAVVRAATGQPIAPSECTAQISNDGSSVDVSWSPAGRDFASRYVVERRRNQGKWYWAGRTTAPGTTFTDDTLRPQDSYQFQVYTRAWDAEKGWPAKRSGLRPCQLTSAAPSSQQQVSGAKTPIADKSQSATNQPSTSPKSAVPKPAAPQPEPTPQLPRTTVNSSGPVPIPACGAYWGSYVNSSIYGGGTNAQARQRAITKVENDIGRRFDIDHQFYRWDDFADDHNVNNYIKPSAAQGRIPFMSWKPVFRSGKNVSWRAIANGQHDALIKRKAASVKSISSPVIVVLDHEANARVGPFQPNTVPSSGGHTKTDSGSEADFVAAWRHVHTVFEQEGVTNVSWAWVMSRTPFQGDAKFADRMYPGDAYVDWVGVDPYNFFHGRRNWVSMETQMQGFTSWNETRQINKPWILAEWGSVEDPSIPGRKGNWHRETADYFQSEPRIKALVHYDSRPAEDWRYDSSPSSKQAFSEVSKRPYFNQKC